MNQRIMNVITQEAAEKLKLGRLTTPYKKCEEWMLENAIKDMERGNIRHAVVQAKEGVELWRAGIRTTKEAERMVG